jgi:DNA-binding response OmpR family regulator
VTETAGGLVLVVDDDEMVRRLVRTVLEADDYKVVDAKDGAEALAMLEAAPGDDGAGAAAKVVILDVMMPGLDGVEVCRKIDHSQVKVVMLTARDDPVLEDACMEAGADVFLTKPFSSTRLLDVVEGLLS